MHPYRQSSQLVHRDCKSKLKRKKWKVLELKAVLKSNWTWTMREKVNWPIQISLLINFYLADRDQLKIRLSRVTTMVYFSIRTVWLVMEQPLIKRTCTKYLNQSDQWDICLITLDLPAKYSRQPETNFSSSHPNSSLLMTRSKSKFKCGSEEVLRLIKINNIWIWWWLDPV